MPRKRCSVNATRALGAHNSASGTCALAVKRTTGERRPVTGGGHSPPSKKQYRSSDARWRRNLKLAFRVVRDVSSPEDCGVPVAGKNMRRDILIEAMTVMQQLEDDISLFINIREVREHFERFELRNCFPDGGGDVPDDVLMRRKKQPPPLMITHAHQHQPQQQVTSIPYHVSSLSGQELLAGASTIIVIDESQVQEPQDGFDLVSYLTSTPKGDAGLMTVGRRSKNKFAGERKPDSVRRRLNLDEVADEGSPGALASLDLLDQSVEEYLETSFTQLLSQGGGVSIESVPYMEFSESGACASTSGLAPHSVAFDVEISSCAPATTAGLLVDL